MRHRDANKPMANIIYLSHCLKILKNIRKKSNYRNNVIEKADAMLKMCVSKRIISLEIWLQMNAWRQLRKFVGTYRVEQCLLETCIRWTVKISFSFYLYIGNRANKIRNFELHAGYPCWTWRVFLEISKLSLCVLASLSRYLNSFIANVLSRRLEYLRKIQRQTRLLSPKDADTFHEHLKHIHQTTFLLSSINASETIVGDFNVGPYDDDGWMAWKEIDT